MKKVLCLIIAFVFLLTGCSLNNTDKEKQDNSSETVTKSDGYIKSVWITYYELKNMICDTQEEFFYNFSSVINNLSEMGFNTVTVQVRPFADAFYVSKYFPSSSYCFGKQGVKMLYDPLEIMCDVASKYDFNIEAWINPYRISQSDNADNLSDDNYAKKWLNNDKTKSYVYVCDNGIYFNPSVKDVNELIVNGVKEIVENYSVTAIHFDDYFYPTTDKDIDSIQYDEYVSGGGKLKLSDWRRENISNMVSSVYNAIKNINQNIKFGISPASNIENDYNTLYADVEKWCGNQGYIDYICPQIYYGFKNVYQPFMFTTKKWVSISQCDLYIGLPLYKSGKKDKNASADDNDIINEFVDNNDIISRQIIYISKINKIKGFYIFSYSSLYDENAKKETENLIKTMQNNSLG